MQISNHRFDNGVIIIGLLVATFFGILLYASTLPIAFGAMLLLVFGGTTVLVLRQPLWGLAIALSIAPFGAWEAKQPLLGALPLATGQLALVGVVLVWGISWLARRRSRLPYFALLLPLIIFIVTAMISLLSASSMALGAKEVVKWLEVLLIIWIVLDCTSANSHTSLPPPRTAVPQLLFLLLITIGSQAILGIWQFTRLEGPDSFLILDRFYRASGTFEQPNPFGGFMAMGALLAIGILLERLWLIGYRWWVGEWQANWTDLAWLAISSSGAIIIAIALVASWSRGAWLGFAAGCVVIAFFWPRRLVFGFLLLAVGGFILGGMWQLDLLPSSITDRITSSADFELRNLRDIQLSDANYALLERLAFWQAAAEMGEQSLWWGVGFGNFDAAYAEFAPEGWPQSLGHAHNYYLNLLAEVGFFGLTAYLAFWLFVFYQSWRILNVVPAESRGVILGLLGVWTAITVHHLVDKLYVNNMYFHIAVMLAIQQLIALDGRENLRSPRFQS